MPPKRTHRRWQLDLRSRTDSRNSRRTPTSCARHAISYPLAAEGCEETHAHRLTPTTRDDAHPSYVVALLEGPPEAAEDEAAETNKFSHSGTWENKSVTGQFSSDSPVMVMCARHNSCNAAIKAARSLPKLKMSRENRANGG